jgi:short-subunit dehydrogenase
MFTKYPGGASMPPIDYSHRTALITGASSGLGAEFARQLAARGADLVLVARRADRLEALADELREAHGVAVTPIALDLSTPGAAAELTGRLEGLGIDVHTLVNNAGFGMYGPFAAADGARITEQVQLNVAALVDLSRALFPTLTAHGDGALINIASTAAYQPIPSMAVYGATKAFVLSFTEALWKEAQPSGLRVLALSPGATRTEFFDVVGTEQARSGSYKTAEEVVALALSTLDRRNPPPSVVSGRGNRFNIVAMRLVSRRMLVNIVARVMAPRGATAEPVPAAQR